MNEEVVAVAGQVRERAGDADEDPYGLPVTHQIELKGHAKLVGAAALDAPGARLVTGANDYGIRLYDFGGMTRDLRPFRELSAPCGEYPLRALSWSPDHKHFVAVAGSAQPKVFDREGREEGVFPRGDMYIRDMKNTKGHIVDCTGGEWHPRDTNVILTASADGTLRTWDLNLLGTANGPQKAVIKPKLQKPGRYPVTACCYSDDGDVIAGGLTDGTVQLWSSRQGFHSAAVGQVLPPKAQMHLQNTWSVSNRVEKVLKGAHPAGEEVTCLRFSRDGNTLLQRVTDGTLRVWDIRQLKSPLKVWEDLPCDQPGTQCCFSPDESLILTGVSADRGGTGALVFFNKQRLEFVRRLGFAGGSAVTAQWHPRLNQVLVGGGDRSGGLLRVLYSPELSEKGALLCANRAPRKKDPLDVSSARPVIYTPHALPLFKDEGMNVGSGLKRRREEKVRLKDPTATKKPAMMQEGRGKGGELGATGGTLLTAMVMKDKGVIKPDWQTEDPRAALLKHAEAAEKDGRLVGRAYAATQPVPVFAEASDDDDEDGQ